MVLFANGIWSFRALGCFFSLPLWFITGYWIPEVSDPLDLRQTCAGRQVLQGEGARNKSGYSKFTDVGCCFSTTDATGDEDGVGENVWVGVCPGREMRSPGCSRMEEGVRSICDCHPWAEREWPWVYSCGQPSGAEEALGRAPLRSKARIRGLTQALPPNCSMNVSKLCSLICENGYNNRT